MDEAGSKVAAAPTSRPREVTQLPPHSESAQRFLDAVQAAVDNLTVACAGVDSWRQQVAKTIGVNAEQAVRHFRTDGLQHCPKLEPVRVAYCVTCLGCEAQLRIALRISSTLALQCALLCLGRIRSPFCSGCLWSWIGASRWACLK